MLTYTIHFQNTGTAATNFIIVKDTLSANLDPTTVRTIASSAKISEFTITGKGILTWTMNPYHLPDSLSDASGSKGFITFQVNAKRNLPIGTIISNTASIYFDYNGAVVTNTVADTVANPTAIRDLSGNNNGINVAAFPNPFKDATNIVITGLNEKYNFELYDVTGRIERSFPSMNVNEFQLQRGDLAEGLYTYRIIVNNKPVAYGKLLVQ
jgi:fimbrial isopeptide formation D2 family protein